MIRLGRISYVNMAPVFHRLNAEVEEVQGVPTELNAMLLDGQLDLAPISSIEYARHAASLRILPRMCVSSEGAVDSIEYLHRGDTAIVSMQYSYLPSWITILVDPVRSIDSENGSPKRTCTASITLPAKPSISTSLVALMFRANRNRVAMSSSDGPRRDHASRPSTRSLAHRRESSARHEVPAGHAMSGHRLSPHRPAPAPTPSGSKESRLCRSRTRSHACCPCIPRSAAPGSRHPDRE